MGPGFPVRVELYVSHPRSGERAHGETRLPSEQPKALGRWATSLAQRGAAVRPSCSSPLQRTGSASPSEGTWPRGGIYSQIWIYPTGSESPTEGTSCVPAAVGRADRSCLSRHRLLGGGSRDVFIRGPTANPHGQGTPGTACQVPRVLCAVSQGCQETRVLNLPEGGARLCFPGGFALTAGTLRSGAAVLRGSSALSQPSWGPQDAASGEPRAGAKRPQAQEAAGAPGATTHPGDAQAHLPCPAEESGSTGT